MAIRIFVTGGTFDKKYDEIRGRLFFKDTHVGEMLELGRSRVDVTVHTLMMIDSLEMTDADRKVIVGNCRACAERRIVITHGTDTARHTRNEKCRAVSNGRCHDGDTNAPTSKRTRKTLWRVSVTMVETARALADGVPAKTIVLTGAMVPYAFGSSDGLFNLGSAVSFAQVLPAGVFIAMNGRALPWARARKNRETGFFEEA